jgi:protein SCO1/2
MKVYSLLIVFLFYLSSQAVEGQSTVQIGIDEQLGKYLPKDIEIVDINGNKVQLSSLLDKPTIINFVYYRCPGICTPLMNGLAEVINLSDLELGKDYQVITISFDPREGYELAEKKRNNYSMLVKKPGMEQGWRFFVADSVNVKKATDAVGFRYKPMGNDFVHSASLCFVTPDGKITRYLNGTYFLPFELKLAVNETAKGQVGGNVNKLLEFCYSYDPTGKTYVMNITKISGTIILFMGLLVFGILYFYPKRHK